MSQPTGAQTTGAEATGTEGSGSGTNPPAPSGPNESWREVWQGLDAEIQYFMLALIQRIPREKFFAEKEEAEREKLLDEAWEYMFTLVPLKDFGIDEYKLVSRWDGDGLYLGDTEERARLLVFWLQSVYAKLDIEPDAEAWRVVVQDCMRKFLTQLATEEMLRKLKHKRQWQSAERITLIAEWMGEMGHTFG